MSCFISSCKSHSSRKREFLSFHQFPKDGEIREKWLKLIPRAAEYHGGIRLCSKHFFDSCFVTNNKWRRLKPDAIPSLFLDEKSSDEINTEYLKVDRQQDPLFAVSGASYQELIKMNDKLEKKLDRVKTVSQRRLKKIKVLQIRMDRLIKKNRYLYDRLQQALDNKVEKQKDKFTISNAEQNDQMTKYRKIIVSTTVKCS